MADDRDRFWGYVTRRGFKGGFHCGHCGSKFKNGGPRKIQYHLAKRRGSGIRACTGKVPKEIRLDCLKALLLMEANTKPKLAPPNSSGASSILDKVVEVMKSMLARHAFVPSMASILLFVRGIPMAKERNNDLVSVIPDAGWGKLGKFNSKYLEDVLVAYKNMKELLEMKDNLDVKKSVHSFSGDVDDSLRYQEMVESVLQNNDFWVYGNQFVQLIEPLVRVLHVLTVSGTTIGHACRCLETAKAEYELKFSPSDEVFVQLNELWEAALTPLSKAAAVLNPSYLGSPSFDKADAVKRLYDFKEQYVLEEHRVEFKKEVHAYLEQSPKLFHSSAMSLKDTYHPAIFWYHSGHGLPILRRYAMKLVIMKYTSVPPTDVDLQKLFASEKNVDRHQVYESGQVYQECNADLLSSPLFCME